MKYVAKIKQVIKPNIHKAGSIINEVFATTEMELPDFIEIEVDEKDGETCFMYRYKNDGTICGDTWHENLASALTQAKFEYGLTNEDFEKCA